MKLRYRTVFLSDLHLGSTGARARELSKLLKKLQCEQLYLVGDVIDMWRLRRKWFWPADHNDVVRRILKIASRKKTEVIFLPGNHDEAARQYHHLEFGGVRVEPYAVHETADGRRLLVIHGDQFDLVVKHSPLLSMAGALAYEWLQRINRVYNRGRALLGLRYWSLSNYLKMRVKKACTFISRFEETLSREAKRQKLEGVICGHIHKAEIAQIDGIEYYNCGDWVESCTVLVEHFDGRLEVLDGLELLEQVREAKQRDREERRRKADRNNDQPRYTPLVHEPDDEDEPAYADLLTRHHDDSAAVPGRMANAEHEPAPR